MIFAKFKRKRISWAKAASSERDKDRFFHCTFIACGRTEDEVEGDRGYLGLEGLYTLMSMSWDSSQGMHL